MSVQAGGMRRNDSTCKAQVFPSNTHIVLPVAQKLVCFLFFSDSRSHILIKTNPQYTIFELIKTSLSLVPFHFLPHLHLAGGRGLSANWSHDQNIAAWLEPAFWFSAVTQTNFTFHGVWSGVEVWIFFHMEGKTRFINIIDISQNRPSLRRKRLQPP